METWMQLAFENAGQVAAGVVLAVFVMAMGAPVLFKALGFSGIGDKSKLVDEGKMSSVSAGVSEVKNQLVDVEKRLGAVESDLQNRPTKDDIHRLELSFTRLEGQMASSAATIQATAVAIGRIEDYMYQAAARKGSERN